jgi:hypothetical protein
MQLDKSQVRAYLVRQTYRRFAAPLIGGLVGLLLSVAPNPSARNVGYCLGFLSLIQGAIAASAGSEDERFLHAQIQAIAKPQLKQMSDFAGQQQGEIESLNRQLESVGAELSAARQAVNFAADNALTVERESVRPQLLALESEVLALRSRLSNAGESAAIAFGELQELARDWIKDELSVAIASLLSQAENSGQLAGLHPELAAYRQQRIQKQLARRTGEAQQFIQSAIVRIDSEVYSSSEPVESLERLMGETLDIANDHRNLCSRLAAVLQIATTGESKILARQVRELAADKQSAIEIIDSLQSARDELDGHVEALQSSAQVIQSGYVESLDRLAAQTVSSGQPVFYGADAPNDYQRISDWFAGELFNDGVRLDAIHGRRTRLGFELKYNYVGSDFAAAQQLVNSKLGQLKVKAVALANPDVIFTDDETVKLSLQTIPLDPNQPVQWPSWVKTGEALLTVSTAYANVRISGGTGAGKSPLASCIAVAAISQGKASTVQLNNPVSGLLKDSWRFPALARTEDETISELLKLAQAIGGDGSLDGRSRVVIWDELNKALKGNREAKDAVDSAQKTVSHLGELHLWLSQNANVSALGQQLSDRSNWMHIIIGYKSIDEYLSKSDPRRTQLNELRQLAGHENQRQGLVKTDSDFIRFAMVETPDGEKDAFYLLPPFTQATTEIKPLNFDETAPEFKVYAAAYEAGRMDELLTARQDKQGRFSSAKARELSRQLLTVSSRQESVSSGQNPSGVGSGQQPSAHALSQSDGLTVGDFPGRKCPSCGNGHLVKMSDGRASCRKSDGGCGRRISPAKLLKA